MRTRNPRLRQLPESEFDTEQEEVSAPLREQGPLLNASRTLIRHPKAQAAFRVWTSHVMEGSTLEARHREIVALRVAWNVKAGYMWGQHVLRAEQAGLSAEEMDALKKPVEAHDWPGAESALIRAVDSLVREIFIPDDVWGQLASHFSERQCMDVILGCGHFIMLGMFLNTAGVEIDPEVPADPDLEKFG